MYELDLDQNGKSRDPVRIKYRYGDDGVVEQKSTSKPLDKCCYGVVVQRSGSRPAPRPLQEGDRAFYKNGVLHNNSEGYAIIRKTGETESWEYGLRSSVRWPDEKGYPEVESTELYHRFFREAKPNFNNLGESRIKAKPIFNHLEESRIEALIGTLPAISILWVLSGEALQPDSDDAPSFAERMRAVSCRPTPPEQRYIYPPSIVHPNGVSEWFSYGLRAPCDGKKGASSMHSVRIDQARALRVWEGALDTMPRAPRHWHAPASEYETYDYETYDYETYDCEHDCEHETYDCESCDCEHDCEHETYDCESCDCEHETCDCETCDCEHDCEHETCDCEHETCDCEHDCEHETCDCEHETCDCEHETHEHDCGTCDNRCWVEPSGVTPDGKLMWDPPGAAPVWYRMAHHDHVALLGESAPWVFYYRGNPSAGSPGANHFGLCWGANGLCVSSYIPPAARPDPRHVLLEASAASRVRRKSSVLSADGWVLHLRSERFHGERSRNKRSRGERSRNKRPRGERSHTGQSRGERSHGERPHNKRSRGERSRGERSRGERSRGERSRGERSRGEQSRGERSRK